MDAKSKLMTTALLRAYDKNATVDEAREWAESAFQFLITLSVRYPDHG